MPALVESTKKAGNVVHIAEASSGALADPTRAIKPSLDAPALNLPVPQVGCAEPRPIVTPPFPALAAGRRERLAIRCSSSTPMVRAPRRPVVQVGDRKIASFA
jgi:hypothetical protein